ncbi:hypothetical protein [Cellulomonas bogoriensis]|uniref:Uncharacterized protein n=1 Tax=Cellulomonas bogoriensis 69B4 = DSM 16987 TaxID=1386082 RepID=A0A0A0C2E0_9CELL|nr:hypothetical protein [Cellulomonas bogoriensis]KGM14335.1 hypothetical protein N869_15105 [Cellulomonas bogoriensis 69B4 = DSM 16987]
MLQTFTLSLGGVLTLAGALFLVRAFRQGQEGLAENERRTFRLSVVLLAAGSALFLVTTVLAENA